VIEVCIIVSLVIILVSAVKSSNNLMNDNAMDLARNSQLAECNNITKSN